MKQKTEAVICNQKVVVKKDWYDGLWNIVYESGGTKYAGPYKTKREAVERLAAFVED